MSDHPNSLPPAPATLASDPSSVSLRARHDGWTPERQRRFLKVLADTGSVTEAADSISISREAAYRLRRRADGAAFAEAWQAALAVGTRRLVDLAFERAIEGVAVPVFHAGKLVGEKRVYSERLLMFLLQRHYSLVETGGLAAPRPYDRRKADEERVPLTRRFPVLLNRLLRRVRPARYFD